MGGASTVAPQREQLNWPPSMDAPHQGQVIFGPARWIGGGGTDGGWMEGGVGRGCSGAGAAARFTWDPHDPQKFAASEILEPQLVQNILDELPS